MIAVCVCSGGKNLSWREKNIIFSAVVKLARDLWSFELQSQETCLEDCEKTVMDDQRDINECFKKVLKSLYRDILAKTC